MIKAVGASLSIGTVHEIRDQCLCLATQRAARRLGRRFDRLFAPLGLTNQQFSMLVALSGLWRPRMGQLAEFLDMDSTTMTAAIKPLAKRGLMMLLTDEGDARVRRPALTETGREVVAQAVPLWREEHAKLQTELVGQDAAALVLILGQVG